MGAGRKVLPDLPRPAPFGVPVGGSSMVERRIFSADVAGSIPAPRTSQRSRRRRIIGRIQFALSIGLLAALLANDFWNDWTPAWQSTAVLIGLILLNLVGVLLLAHLDKRYWRKEFTRMLGEIEETEALAAQAGVPWLVEKCAHLRRQIRRDIEKYG